MHAMLLTVGLVLEFATPAAPPVAIVVGAAPGRLPSDAPLHVRKGTRITLYPVVRMGRGWRARYYTDAPSLALAGRRIRRKRIRPLARLRSVRVRWYRVEPYQHHKKLKFPNRGNPAYSNAVLFGRHHGRWLGFDTLEYHETLLASARGSRWSLSQATPSHKKVNRHGGLGTMRYRVQVTWAQGGRAASPGAAATVRGGISERVMRVSWRAADDLVGWLTSYYNVPNVFGSAGPGARHQTERYQGADCADIIVGAARRAGAKLRYTHAAGLTRYARKVTPKLLLTRSGLVYAQGARKGQRARLRFGKEVRRGDLMLIDYVGFNATGRGWDHVGVVSADRGVKGWLDPADHHIHMGYKWGLMSEPLSAEGKAVVQFLRFGPRVQRAMARWRRRQIRARKRLRKSYRSRRREASPVRAR
jgi:hypothetical protein